jgi:ketosteroid isomerase-like protein
MADNVFAVADSFFDAVASGELDKVARIYAPDALIWHNTDNTVKGPAVNIDTLRWLSDNVENFRYEDVRQIEIPGGFLRQHVCRGRVKGSGQELTVPIAVVAQVTDGRITRLEEYFDSAQGAKDIPLGAE